MQVLIGRRQAVRLPKPDHAWEFPPGYSEDVLCYWPCGRQSFDLNLPGAGLACLAGHQVTQHPEDGTISAYPSILLNSPNHATGDKSAHGYLEHGWWRDA